MGENTETYDMVLTWPEYLPEFPFSYLKMNHFGFMILTNLLVYSLHFGGNNNE